MCLVQQEKVREDMDSMSTLLQIYAIPSKTNEYKKTKQKCVVYFILATLMKMCDLISDRSNFSAPKHVKDKAAIQATKMLQYADEVM